MPKLCDTNPNLPCIYMGKCRGRVGLTGPVRPLRKRSEIEECPCLEEVQAWVEKREAQMQYCDRIKARMLHLPCGLREECFLLPKCPKCLAENPPKREPFSIAV